MSCPSNPTDLKRPGAQPYFTYTEIFTSGHVHTSWSVGNGIFFDQEPHAPSGTPCFTVLVNRNDSTLSVSVYSELLESVLDCFNLPGAHYANMGLEDVLLGYNGLTSTLALLEQSAPSNTWYKCLPEMRLFASDFLLDRDIFGIFGLEHLYELGLLDPSHWQDMQRCMTLRDLDQIDQAVSLDFDDYNPPDQTWLLDPAILTGIRCAIYRGDLDCVRQLLVGQPGLIDAYTLNTSLEQDQLDIFWALLNHGAFIDSDSSCRLSEPLYTAAEWGHFNAVRALLERGANINGSLFQNPLEAAAGHGHISIVRYLIDNGADINGGHCRTPLEAAAKHGYTSIVRYLVDNGADINGYLFQNPLEAAAGHGHISIVRYLTDNGADINGNYCQTPLEAAAKHGHTSIVRYLVDNGANINGKYSQNPLEAAAKHGHTSIMRYLVDNGANINGKYFQNPLEAAAKHGHTSIARYLVENGANINGNRCQNPLEAAAEHGHISIVQYLFDNSADISHVDDYGSTALTKAAHHTQHDFELYLIGRGAEVNVCSQQAMSEFRQRILGSSLRRAFRKAHQRFLLESTKSSASEAFASLETELGPAAAVWKKGTFTIRRLTERSAPESLDQVISCLLVADAMRTTVMSDKSAGAHKAAPIEFINDFDRWRSLLQSDDERTLYDEIVRSVWGSSPSPRFNGEEDPSLGANIGYLQNLVSNLVSETSSLTQFWGLGFNHIGGYRLHCMHQFHGTKEPGSFVIDDKRSERNGTFSASEKEEPPDNGGSRPSKALWETSVSQNATGSQQIAIMLMAGAVFGTILAFLVVLRWGVSPHPTAQTDNLNHRQGALASGEILARNCALLIVYLGLQGAPAPAPTQRMEEAERPFGAGFQSSPPQLDISRPRENLSIVPQTQHGGQTGSPQSPVPSRVPRPLEGTLNNSSISPCSSAPPSISPSQPSIGDLSSSPAKPRPICSQCNKSFSNTANLNKHVRYDCREALTPRFPCRNSGCKGRFSREAYRNKHEQTRCKALRRLRMPVEESLNILG